MGCPIPWPYDNITRAYALAFLPPLLHLILVTVLFLDLLSSHVAVSRPRRC
jgi:hypothetical protein